MPSQGGAAGALVPCARCNGLGFVRKLHTLGNRYEYPRCAQCDGAGEVPQSVTDCASDDIDALEMQFYGY